MAASKAKIGAALAAVIAGGGAVAVKTMSKASRTADNVAAAVSTTSRNADNFAKLADEAKLSKHIGDGTGNFAGAANRSAGDNTHGWMSEATWGDVKTNIAESFATEGAARAIEGLHRDDPNLQLRAFSASSPAFAFVPPTPETDAFDATGRSVLADPDSLQILLNARANPLMLAAVGDQARVVAPDGTKIEVNGIHYLCRQSQVTCFVIATNDRDKLLELAAIYESISRLLPGVKVSEWQALWEGKLAGTAFSMSVTPYPQAEGEKAEGNGALGDETANAEQELTDEAAEDQAAEDQAAEDQAAEDQAAEDQAAEDEQEPAPRRRPRRSRRGR